MVRQKMKITRNGALAWALVGLALLLFAVSLVRTREAEEVRRRADPNAHAIPLRAQ
jgi:bacteriorhodopsin